MSKKLINICVIFGATAACVYTPDRLTVASDPQAAGKYCVQVPHVVLPETIQYKSFTDRQDFGGSVNISPFPATYTAFPSYSVPDNTEFRTINQLYYPVTSIDQVSAVSEPTAQMSANNQIVPQQETYAGLANVPKFEIPSDAGVQPEAEPIYLTRLDETNNPIRQVSDTITGEPADDETPANSIVFLKSQHSAPINHIFDDDFAPSRLSLTASNHLNWLHRESLFVRPTTYNEVAPPTQLGFMQPNVGFQQAQPFPAYGQLCQQNSNYNNCQPQYQQYGVAPMPHPSYTAATGLNSAWGAYLGAASQQQMMPAQSQNYQSLTQLGGMMPVISGQPMQHMIPIQQPMQPVMQPAMQQQTIGYIVLYPQAAQSGVNMQLVGKQDSGNDDGTTAEGESTADSNMPNWNNMQFQATFIPAQQMPNYTGQPTMPQMPMPNPMAMGGMNPYMMNPMMMGGMNPYMMNPMMMGMGGMMPPIIIQMPAAESGGRRSGGLFARIRAGRQESQSSSQQASSSLASLFTQQNQMPAKSAYPYGYFGATGSPYQSGSFGGYHDMSTQTVRYPGM